MTTNINRGHEPRSLTEVEERFRLLVTATDATARRKAEEALRQSEELHRTLFESIDEGVCFFERLPTLPDGLRDYRYIAMNRAMREMFGVDDLTGRTIRECFPHEAEAWYDDYDRVLETGRPIRFERESEPQDKVLSMFVTRVEDGTGTRLMAVMQDVTERKRSEADLRRSEADARQIQTLSAELVSQDNVRAVYEKIVNAAATVMRSGFASIQLLDPDAGPSGQLELLAFRGFNAEAARFWQRVRIESRSSCGEALRTRERVVVPDVEACDFLAGSADLKTYLQTGIRAVQTTPLVTREGTFVGMLSTHWGGPHEPSERDLRNLDVIARQAADLIERTKAQDSLIDSERRLAEELADMSRLHEVGTRLAQAGDATALVLDIVDAAIAATDADMGSIQLRERGCGRLRIMASRGFEAPFLDFFNAVHDGQAACGTAMQTGERIIIEDVTTSPVFVGTPALDVLLAAGVRAVQSTPLVNRSGSLVGMLSTHYRTPRRPAERDLRLLDLLARQAADYIERMYTQEDLREQAKQLREADRRKDEFLAMLAHELRNPLAAVGNAATVLKMSEDPANVNFAKDVIERQTRQLAHLIEDLLDVSRITSGKIRLKRERCDAGPILKQAIESASPLIRERKHTLITEFEEGKLPFRVDPTRVEQMVVNLLTNAAKYSENGKEILLSARRDEDEIVISVKDQGIGIPPEKLPQMFELFAQGERSIARSEGGLGLGLTIVQKLADMHGGSVTATSEGLGHGSTFTVRLPAESQPALVQGEGQAPSQVSVRRASRILVVDDNVDTTQSMVRLLKLLGNDVMVAYDGLSAIDKARILRPEYILLDIGLPGMDGYDVARRLREEPCCKATVIIAVSGYGQEEDRRRSRDAGFDHHLVKPVDFDSLLPLIDRPL
jgi:PAS domain S-box-containing protein